MDAKIKAKELVNKVSFNGLLLKQGDAPSQYKKRAKQCALIAVDEIILALPDASEDDSPYNHELVWWQQVKQEIENL